MDKPIAHVEPLCPQHWDVIGYLIDAIEKDKRFEVVIDTDEKGGFTVVVRE